jgi:NADH dehydrogenase FAD-containing subunit
MDGTFHPPARHVLIVGGGASGALMAAHLLHNAPETRVTIVEKRGILPLRPEQISNQILNQKKQNPQTSPLHGGPLDCGLC